MRTFRVLRWTKSNNAGYTLIELAVVILILGFILAFTLPNFAGLLTGDELGRNLRQLSGLIQYLRDQAISGKKIYRLNYNFKEKEFWITTFELTGETKAATNPIMARRLKLEGAIEVSDMITPAAQGRTTEGETYINFLPNGLVDPGVIHLTDRDKETTYTLIIKPLTGRVRILDRYVEQLEKPFL